MSKKFVATDDGRIADETATRAAGEMVNQIFPGTITDDFSGVITVPAAGATLVYNINPAGKAWGLTVVLPGETAPTPLQGDIATLNLLAAHIVSSTTQYIWAKNPPSSLSS